MRVRERNPEQDGSEARVPRKAIPVKNKPQSGIQSVLEFTRPGQLSQETPSIVGRLFSLLGCPVVKLRGTLGGGKNPDGLVQAEIDTDGYLRGGGFSVYQARRILPLFYRVRSSLSQKERSTQRLRTDDLSILIDTCGNRDDTLDVRLLRGRGVYEPRCRNQFRIAHRLGGGNWSQCGR